MSMISRKNRQTVQIKRTFRFLILIGIFALLESSVHSSYAGSSDDPGPGQCQASNQSRMCSFTKLIPAAPTWKGNICKFTCEYTFSNPFNLPPGGLIQNCTGNGCRKWVQNCDGKETKSVCLTTPDQNNCAWYGKDKGKAGGINYCPPPSPRFYIEQCSPPPPQGKSY